MATDIKNVDLLQKFIDNEKKAKTWTLVSVSLFCLLAFGMIYLAWKLQTAQGTISSQTKEIENLNKALKIALNTADSLNDVLAAENKNLEKRSTNYDSLQYITNSLLMNLAELQKAKPAENVVSQNIAVIDKPTQVRIENLIKPSNIEKIQEKEDKYTIYIQFADGYKDQAALLQRWWKKDYICPQPEFISNRSFAASVNYFYSEDEEEARKVAKLTEEKIGLPVKVNMTKMKAPKKQLEVWIGKYQPKTTEQILKKYEVNNALIDKKSVQMIPVKKNK